jgi:L-ascorbate metabolism protein UlaG (beta-lactamase superfamily)
MRLAWLGHACFLLEGDGLRILTDPYHPEILGLPPIRIAADVVIRSSADDRAHAWVEGLPGRPAVITATEIGEEGAEIKGLRILAVPTREGPSKPQPRDNAMYLFELEGIAIGHFGDVGNRLSPRQLERMRGVEVALVPVGGPPTIELTDLEAALTALQPAVVVPMHYRIPGARPRMLPVTDFTTRFPTGQVEWRGGAEMELSQADLALAGGRRRVIVLPPLLAID